jgi:hypothetical protein
MTPITEAVVEVFDPQTKDERPGGQTASRRIRLIPFEDIMLSTTAAYLIKDIIPREGLIVVYGSPKSGKSFKAFDMSLHVALGWSYRGRRVKQGSVVYCAFEGQRGLAKRKEAWRQRFLADHEGQVPFYLQPVSMRLVQDHPELITEISETLTAPPALVVLDTLNRSFAGSESSDEDMTAYVHAADAIREAFGCAVVIVHHTGIDGSRPRGHTSLPGAVDVQIKIDKDAETGVVTMTVELAKDGPEGDTFTSRLEVVEVGQDEDGDPITSCIVVSAEPDPRSPESQLTGQAKVAFMALRMALDEIGEPSPGGDRYPSNVRTVMVSAWQTYCDAVLVADTAKPDSRRTAFVRAFRKLQELGFVGVWADLCWIVEPPRTHRT